MHREGSIVLFSFPETGGAPGKVRPALLLRKLPNSSDDWLICLISSQLRHRVLDLNEVIYSTDKDFPQSGLKVPSLFRASRLNVSSQVLFRGIIGKISDDRLKKLRANLANWLLFD